MESKSRPHVSRFGSKARAKAQAPVRMVAPLVGSHTPSLINAHDQCCNGNCAQGDTCPVRLAAHSPDPLRQLALFWVVLSALLGFAVGVWAGHSGWT